MQRGYKNMRIIIAAAAVAMGFGTLANAATYTLSATGNWGSSATWGGAGIPGASDDITLGTFTLTVDAARSANSMTDSGSAKPAITVNNPLSVGTVNFSSNQILTFSGTSTASIATFNGTGNRARFSNPSTTIGSLNLSLGEVAASGALTVSGDTTLSSSAAVSLSVYGTGGTLNINRLTGALGSQTLTLAIGSRVDSATSAAGVINVYGDASGNSDYTRTTGKISFGGDGTKQGSLYYAAKTGTLNIMGANALGSAPLDINNGNGASNATMDLSVYIGGAYNVANNITLTGNTNATPGAESYTIGSKNAASTTATYSGTVSLGKPVTFKSSNVGATLALTNVISGGSSQVVTIAGPGIVSFGAANTYSGATHVDGGTLVVNGSLLSSTVTVNGGALGGNGSVGALTVTSGGALAPGNSIGTLNVASLDVSGVGAGGLQFELGANGVSDKVNATGAVALGTLDFSDFAFTPTAPLADSYTYTLLHGGSLTGSIGTASGSLGDGVTGTLSLSGNDVILTVAVPEPGTVAMFAGVVGLALLRRDRKRVQA